MLQAAEEGYSQLKRLVYTGNGFKTTIGTKFFTLAWTVTHIGCQYLFVYFYLYLLGQDLLHWEQCSHINRSSRGLKQWPSFHKLAFLPYWPPLPISACIKHFPGLKHWNIIEKEEKTGIGLLALGVFSLSNNFKYFDLHCAERQWKSQR